LFNNAAWKTAKNVLALIKQGFISDPPGIPLYSQIGIDVANGGLPIYRCARGTNFTEGGVYSHLRPRMPTSGASIRHVNASLQDFVIRHNLLVRILDYSHKFQVLMIARLGHSILPADTTKVISAFG
jgi:hypothetical protein